MNAARNNPSGSCPPIPNNIGKRRLIKSQAGKPRHFIIEDEIIQPQSNACHKLIVFQKVYLEEEGRYEFRLAYYMLGIKGKPKGKWVWGRYCLFIPEKDLSDVMRKARKKNWF